MGLGGRELAEDERSRRLQPLYRQQLQRRFNAIDEIVDYLAGAQIAGDYLEFGVYRGATFAHACRRFAAPAAPHLWGTALGSVQGLPQPSRAHARGGSTARLPEAPFRLRPEQVCSQ